MRARWAVIVMGLMLGLAACGGTDGDEAATSDKDAAVESEAGPETADEGEDVYEDRGTITIGDRAFTFNPITCWVDADDTEVNGPGREKNGDVVYVDFSGGGSEFAVRIELGTDSPFESTDAQITADQYVTEPLVVTIDGLDVTATGVFLDEHGQTHAGELAFTCA